jgi:5'-nucleotidase
LAEILLTNDDGVHSAGVTSLAHSLSLLGHVTTVAPDREMSASSQSITLLRPVRYQQIGPDRYSVEGTPADCVIIALNHILPKQPDLVISGINKGSNLGHDIAYSGTVAGAMEAARHGIQAAAISLATRDRFVFEEAARFTAHLAEQLLKQPLPEGVILNVNVPGGGWQGVRVTRQGPYEIRNLIVESRDPRGRKCFWLDQELEPRDLPADGDSDYAAVRAGCISITPLKLDQTAFGLNAELSSWADIFSTAACR